MVGRIISDAYYKFRKTMVAVVTEVWDYEHTIQERRKFKAKLAEMRLQGRFFPKSLSPLDNSEYVPNRVNTEKVLKRFIDVEAAQEYIDFLNSYLKPAVSLTITVE